MLPINQILWFVSCGLVRLSVLAFLPRLNRDSRYVKCYWALGSIIIMILVFAYATTSDLFDASKPDRHCISKHEENYMMFTHSIVGIIIDAALFGLPMWIIWGNMASHRQAIKVILVFSIGLLAVATGIVRFGIIITATDFSTDTTEKMTRVVPWTDLEIHIGLWCGSFPALQPILRQVSYRIGLCSNLHSNYRTSQKSEPSAEHGALSNTKHHVVQRAEAVPARDSDEESDRAIITHDSPQEWVELRAAGGILRATIVPAKPDDASIIDRTEGRTVWTSI
ncbi:integral membrane protein [Fusarium sp. NRRL 25303]|nr:integral membrane protein [Fusarium sp. NRRL 25303]